MSIQIRRVQSAKDLKTFIYLPETIHRHHASWLPPLYMDEKTFFDHTKNPQFQENETVMFLAYSDNQVVGRIMGIIPAAFNASQGVHTARFCYFECVEDRTVFDALLDAVENWARRKNCDQLVGPMGFSDKEPQGFLTDGFDEKTMMVTNCSFSFMKRFVEQKHFQPFVTLYQYEVPLNKALVARYLPITDRVLRNLNVRVVEFRSTRAIRPYVQRVFNLINSTYTDIYGFTKVSEKEAADFGKRFLPLLNPKLVKLIVDKDDEVVGFVIAMPDLSRAIRKSRGRIFPTGWFHLLREMKTSKRLALLLGGVDTAMQHKGLDAVLGVRLMQSALDLGFTVMDSHLIMKDNIKMRREIERLDNYRRYKEYTIYSRMIDLEATVGSTSYA